MKKLFLFAIILFSIAGNLQSQDLIVTNSGDSLNCKISKVTKDYVYFAFKHNSEIRKTLLPVDQVIAQEKDYFSVSELPENYAQKSDFQRFRFAIDGGWQYRLAKMADGMDPEWKDHYRKMRSGFHGDLQAACFFTENSGVELMYSQQLFSNSPGEGTWLSEDGSVIASGVADEKIRFDYLGVNYIVRLFDSKKKNCFLMTVGLGYLGYSDKVFIKSEQINKITAGTLGTNIGFGYDIGISNNFSLGLKLSFTGGSFKSYRQTIRGVTTKVTMAGDTSENLSTIRLSVGLRFNR
jgi:hypothetical protein